MSEVEIRIGGRAFRVACQEGEEAFLISAARLLDTEASALVNQLGRMPETQMLLMAGLMLADRTAAIEERLRELEAGAPAPAPAQRIEVPVVPGEVLATLAELAARAESLADAVEERTGT